MDDSVNIYHLQMKMLEESDAPKDEKLIRSLAYTKAEKIYNRVDDIAEQQAENSKMMESMVRMMTELSKDLTTYKSVIDTRCRVSVEERTDHGERLTVIEATQTSYAEAEKAILRKFARLGSIVASIVAVIVSVASFAIGR